MTPRIEACYFTGRDDFATMARVLEATAADQCPGWACRIRAIPSPVRESALGLQQHTQNVHKIAEHWAPLVQEAADGECLVLIDADTAIVRPLEEIWAREFDLAYTTKRRPFPYNLGVLFLRVSDRTRAFFQQWRDENLALLAAREGTNAWRQTYGGINQASFGRLIERGALNDLQVLTVPCREWNCEESGWATFDPAVTRVLHIKGALRRVLYRRFPVTPELERAVAWYRSIQALVTPLTRTA